MKKIYCVFISIFILSYPIIAQNSDSLKINKSVLLFYDSSDFVPVLTQVPYPEANKGLLYMQYENLGVGASSPLSASLDITHNVFPNGVPGMGLVASWTLTLDSLGAGKKDTLWFLNCFVPTVLGAFQVGTKVYDSTGQVLDSSIFQFSTSDTIMSKHISVSSSVKTGPSFFSDTITGQSGGTVVGDRFATLFEMKNIINRFSAVPTSMSVYVSNDSNNIGAEFVPRIWEVNEDSVGTPNFIGDIVASAFVPTTLGASNLGQNINFVFDNGTAFFNGLSAGKYAVGFESVGAMPNGKSLTIGRDTVAEKLQFEKNTFVSFGQDSTWYLIDDLPMINLNLGQLLFSASNNPCQVVGIEEEKGKEKLNVYPNPSTGTLQIDSSEPIQEIRVFDVNGRLTLTQQGIEKMIHLENLTRGLYLLQIQFENGIVKSEKVILVE